MPNIKLRERGIYVLPDGAEFVVCAVTEGGWNMYDAQDWHSFGLADYRIHPDGRIFWKGGLTPWIVDDLADTGRTARLWQGPDDDQG